MKEATKRSISRWIHIVFAIPIIGQIYSPFKELPSCLITQLSMRIVLCLYDLGTLQRGGMLRRIEIS